MNRRLIARVACSVAAIACSINSAAHAADWINANGGSWANPSSWSTGAVPGTGENVNINRASFSDFTVVANTDYTPATAIGNLLVNSPRPSEITFSLTELHADFYAANETIGDNYHAVAVHYGHTTNGISGSLYLGKSTGGRGSYTLSGLALDVGLGEIVGGLGTGTFTQLGGTHTIHGLGTDAGLRIGVSPGSSGTFTLSGGTLDASTEYVGLNGVASFIQNGGTNTTTYVSTAFITASAGGTYALQSGTLNTSYVDNHGTFTQTGGTLAAGYLSNNGGDLTLRGKFSASNGANSGSFVAGGTQTWAPNANFYNIAGDSSFESDAGSATSSTLNLTISGGYVRVHASQHLASLTMTGATVLYTDYGNTPRTVLTVGTLSLDSASRIDLADNELVIRSADMAAVRGLLASGYNDGAGYGTGIMSSVAYGTHRFGYRAIAGGGVDVMYARTADADLNGVVGFSDLLALAQSYGQSNTFWANGDFDFNGTTDFADLLTLAQNYGSTLVASDSFSPSFAADWALAQSLVPEPTSIAALLAIALACRRSRVA